MTLERTLEGKRIIIHTEIIDRDISKLEELGQIGKCENGTWVSPRPNIHGILTCLRDKRKYDSNEIESVCMGACPHPKKNNPIADDSGHLDDCWEYLLDGVSLDGETKYIEYLE